MGTGGTVGMGGTMGMGGQSGLGGSITTGAGGKGGAPGLGGSAGTGTDSVDAGVINPTACSTGSAQASDVTVNLSGTQQKITGFGVSTAWAGSFRDPNKDPDTLWSTTTGAGLTLLRVRIGDGTAIAVKAATYGVKVWATPWEVNSADTTGPNCPGTS